jgi:type IX secretion system PorP/SprF family membrane protein
MTSLRVLFVLILAQAFSIHVLAQQNLVYNHYFLNPYLFNPSFIAPNGYSEMNLNFRKQWASFEGAPTTLTANLQIPVNHKMAYAFNVYNDRAGVLQTNTGAASFAYQVYLGRSTEANHKIGFGLSFGYSMTQIDLSKVDDPSDPSLFNAKTSNLVGQFGMNYQFKDLKIGFALPSLFASELVSQDAFNTPGFDALKNTFTSISYNFKLSNRLAFEPYLLYRTNEIKENQFEALGIIRIDNLLWVGGSYRQDYGPAAFIGFTLMEKLRVGYAYEFAPEIVDGLGRGSHELHLSLRIGKKDVKRPTPAQPEPAPQIVAEQPEEKPKEQPIQPVEEVKIEPVVAQPEIVEEVAEVKPEQEKIVTLSGRGLKPGNYVVVGAFRSNQNALVFMNNLKKEGHLATVSYSPTKEYYYVHMGNIATVEEAAKLRDEYRKENKFNFRDTWVLTVEE